MKTMVWSLRAGALALSVISAQGQENRTFAERLGWKSNDVVVILHVDDVGMSHSSNLGAIEATENGVTTSFSTRHGRPRNSR